jgi:uncharacterized delta-60 repeat protein
MKQTFSALAHFRDRSLPFTLAMTLGLPTVGQDGTLDLVFAPTTGESRMFHAAADMGDGHVLLGGLTEMGGLVRMASDGTIDPTFANDGNTAPLVGAVWSIVPLPDDRYMVGGSFSGYAGLTQPGLVQIMADGTVDPGFQPGASVGPEIAGAPANVYAVVRQPDGRFVVGGQFATYDGHASRGLVRIHADGAYDSSFNVGSGVALGSIGGAVWAIALQADGKLLIGGYFQQYNGTATPYLARLLPDGTLDDTFALGSGPNSLVRAIQVQPDGRILIAGQFTQYNGTPAAGIARLNSDGTLDTSFQIGTGCTGVAGPNVGGAALLLQADGRILLGGWFNAFNGTPRNNVVRLNTDGSVDMSFDPGTGVTEYPGLGNEHPRVRCLHPMAEQRLIVGGVFAKYNGVARNSVARVVNSGVVGIAEAGASPLLGVYPNPFTDQLHLDLPQDSGSLPYVIINAHGAEVAAGRVRAGEAALHLGHLPAGIYLLRVGTAPGVRVVRH